MRPIRQYTGSVPFHVYPVGPVVGSESLRTAGFLCCGFGVLSHPVDDHGLGYAVGGDSHDLELYIVFT